jgi:hypothetical protein
MRKCRSFVPDPAQLTGEFWLEAHVRISRKVMRVLNLYQKVIAIIFKRVNIQTLARAAVDHALLVRFLAWVQASARFATRTSTRVPPA